MTPQKNTTDILAGVAVTALGTAAFVMSYNMPRFENRGGSIFTAPGLTPAVVGAVIAILGFLLVLRGWTGKTAHSGAKPTIADWDKASAARVIFTVFSVFFYGVGLFGAFPFLPATIAFIFLFTVGAELLNPKRSLSIPLLAVSGLALAIAGAFAIRFVFTNIFLVQLPG